MYVSYQYCDGGQEMGAGEEEALGTSCRADVVVIVIRLSC